MASVPLKDLDGHWTTARKNEWPADQKADCLYFECPTCPRNSAGGVHGIMACVTPGLSMYESGAVWEVAAGSIGSIDGLTLTPSIDCTPGGGCTFHGYVRNGRAEW